MTVKSGWSCSPRTEEGVCVILGQESMLYVQLCQRLQLVCVKPPVGSVEVLDVLMGFHQNQMSRQVIFLQTELAPQQRMLKPSLTRGQPN